MRPPDHLLAYAGLTVIAPVPRPREGRAWLGEVRREQGPLRQTRTQDDVMGRYHIAAGTVAPREQRPGALPLTDVPSVLLSGQVEAAGVSPQQAASLRKLAVGLAADRSFG